MNFKKIIPLVAVGILIVSCNKEISSLYNQTLTYQGVFSFVDEIGYVGATKTEREYFKENFQNNIDWDRTIELQPSLKDIDKTDADKALTLITNNLKTNVETLKIGDNLFKNYKFTIGSKDSKQAVINNGKSDKKYTITDDIEEKRLKLSSDDDYFIISIGKGDKTNKQYTSFEYSNGIKIIDLTQPYNIVLKNEITIGTESCNSIAITAIPNFVK